MSGQHNFKQLQAAVKADPQRKHRLERERLLTEAIIELTALREARGATQEQIANAWDATQTNLLHSAETSDIFLATLHSYVAALGGQLQISAVFPDQTIPLASSADTYVGVAPLTAKMS